MRRALGLAVLVPVLFAVACGGSDSNSSAKLSETKRTTTSSTSTSTSTSVDVTTSTLPPVVLSPTTAKPSATATTARPTGTSTTAAPAATTTTTTTAPAAKTWSVSIKNFAFSPPVLQIRVGDTVAVKNDDGPTHTWTADDGSFDSGNLAPGATFSHVFDKAGTVTYHCAIHSSMKGTIQVS